MYQPVQLPKPKPLGTRSTWTTPVEEPSPSGSSPVELKAIRERDRAEKEREERERIERERHERIEREKKEREEKEREEIERLEAERLEAERLETERSEAERLEAERLEAERQEEAARREQAEREELDRIKHERELQRQREIEEERIEKARKEKEEREKREREEEERQRLVLEREQEQEAARLQLEQEQQLAQTVVSADSADSITAIVQFSYDASEDNEMSLIEGEIIRDIIQLDEGWWQGVSADGSKSGLFPANYVEIIENVPEQEAEQQQTVDSTQEQPTAKALYDYSASEGNEISFSDGDIITDIEFVSDDWWQGKAPDGTVGLFPANYVELQNS